MTNPIEAPRSPEEMDRLWAEFQESRDPDAVRKIASALDFEDVVRNKLEKWMDDVRPKVQFEKKGNQLSVSQLEPLYAKGKEISIPELLGLFNTRCGFPIDYERFVIKGPLDLDLQCVYKAREGKLKFEALPFELTEEEVIKMAIKSAAVWSLLDFATRDELVAGICDEESKKNGGAARIHLAP